MNTAKPNANLPPLAESPLKGHVLQASVPGTASGGGSCAAHYDAAAPPRCQRFGRVRMTTFSGRGHIVTGYK